MFRRMKIKASPNLIGGSKKSSASGIKKPVGQPIQEVIIEDSTPSNGNIKSISEETQPESEANQENSKHKTLNQINEVEQTSFNEVSNYKKESKEVHAIKKEAKKEPLCIKSAKTESLIVQPSAEVTKNYEPIVKNEKNNTSSTKNINAPELVQNVALITDSPKSSIETLFSNNTIDLDSSIDKNKNETDMLKSKIRPIARPVNLNLVNKLPGRRTKIKSRPVIPSTKRPVAPTSTPKVSQNSNESSKTVLENKINELNETITQDMKEPKKINEPLINSNCNILERVESKENIDSMKYKEIKKPRHILDKEVLNKPKHTLDKEVLKKPKHISDKEFVKNPRPILDIAIKPEKVKEKKVFYQRKQKYRKKISNGNLERSQMTMFDFIFWNPATNPMPGSNENEHLRSRNNSVNEAETRSVSEAVEEQTVEEEGLQILTDPPSKNTETKSSNISNLDTGTDSPDSKYSPEDDEEEEEETATLAPQVKIGPNGELIVDEQSLVLQTTAAKNRDEILSRTEVVEESNESSHYGKWSKRRKRSTEWTRKETARFYKALSTVGTDFSLMETIFTWRSRAELKVKFKKEERVNRHLIDTALNDCTQFDFTIFDESDYDPEEDRKESKEADKAEAKKKRDLERQQRKMLKQQEKKRKKEEEKMEKLRKRKLKSLYKKRKRKRVAPKAKPPQEAKRPKMSPLVIEAEEVICEVVFSRPGIITTVERNHTQKEDGPSVPPLHSVEPDAGEHASPDQPPILDVRSDETVFISPPPGGDDTISSSSFLVVNDSGPLPQTQNIVIPPELEGSVAENMIPPPELGRSGDQVSEDPISISTIPVSIDAQLLSNICQEIPGTVKGEGQGQALDMSPTQEETLQTASTSSAPSGNQELNTGIVQFCCPVSSVQTSPDGNQFVEIDSPRGIKRISVPSLGPQTSSIVVMATPDPDNPSEQIYHVYAVAPLSANPPSQSVPERAIEEADSPEVCL